MEFDGPTWGVWLLLREGAAASQPFEKLFQAASRHVARNQIHPLGAGEIGRLAKWAPPTAFTSSQVQSMWNFACLVATECQHQAGNDVDKFAKRLRRAVLHSPQASVASEDETLIELLSTTIAGTSDTSSAKLEVREIIIEGSGKAILRVDGESLFGTCELPQGREVLVA